VDISVMVKSVSAMRFPVRKKYFLIDFGLTLKNFIPIALGFILVLNGAVCHGARNVRSYGKGKEEVPARPNALSEDGQLLPYFDNSTNRNVTTQLSKTAFLHCRVRNLGERSVSWIRHHDLHILTVGRYTYTTDQRFQAIHMDNTDDWTLQIKYPQKRDSGLYECQISTEPKMSMFVGLTVIDELDRKPNSNKGNKKLKNANKQSGRSRNKSQRPRHTDVASASIKGSPEMYIKSGSTISLTCDVTQSQQPQAYVFWHLNGKVVNYDSPRGGISVETTKGDVTTSRLLITNAKPSDSGNYTCSPSNADSASIIVHVLNGEKPGALQHGDQSISWRIFSANWVLLLATLLSCVSSIVVR